MPVGALGRGGFGGLGGIEQAQRFARARDCPGADFIGMRKAGGLARYAAQAETRIAAVIGGLQASVIEGEGLGGRELKIELAIVARSEEIGGKAQRPVGIDLAIEQGMRIGGWSHATYVGTAWPDR